MKASSEMLRKIVPLLYQGVSASVDRGASTAAFASGLPRLIRSIRAQTRPWTALPLRGFAGAATQQQPDTAAAALTIDKSTTEVRKKLAVTRHACLHQFRPSFKAQTARLPVSICGSTMHFFAPCPSSPPQLQANTYHMDCAANRGLSFPPAPPSPASLHAASGRIFLPPPPLRHCTQRLKQLQADTPDSPIALRIEVEGGGCSGFQYKFKLDQASAIGPEDS